MTTTQAEKREAYRHMTMQEIVETMTMTELRQNARKGASMAITELERRREKIAAVLLPNPTVNVGV